MTNDYGRAPSGQALAVPVEPASGLAPAGFDPSRCMAELGSLWMNYVRSDHHKDRDCHFVIEQYFSYGDEPYWTAYHSGYVDDGFGLSASTRGERGERRFTTYDRALDYCIAETFSMFRRHAGSLSQDTTNKLNVLSAQFCERVAYLKMVGDDLSPTLASAIEARRAETETGSVHESAASEAGDAQCE
jgi:hypothetical protein